ncbi:MAG: RNase adapter RapZ [Alphaproteobacteria bacterium]|nr:RNase adapter RapZ [Alphaproteobacteria bacterium]MBT4020188.1 RNase adapter RapZ [Alphaproteobacteria bacterium]MBT4964625.1 RNase adapter RapZ [Alphaproteobacteria bacterium]MBT5159296.1 RNase adapter RapZ [Alphaproteobacteria bacterium]MBT5918513.1 RNase adapter RapZ [Alphaproteobacteria bacterium]
MTKTKVVLISGMSGAGKTSVLKCMEDFGYEAIDNLPLALLGRLLHGPEGTTGVEGLADAVAIGIDFRSRDFAVTALLDLMASLRRRSDIDLDLLFLDCDQHTLRRRFTETRRRHPLAADRPVVDGIAHEAELLAPLRKAADLLVDTTNLGVAELRKMMEDRYGLNDNAGMTVTVTSFAYRQGLPREADLVFDVRFLSNPHYDENLSERTGLDAEVGDFIARDPAFKPFLQSLTGLLGQLLPHYKREGKSYLTIAMGCTGGQHRSVYLSERLRQWFESVGETVYVRHRELERDGKLPIAAASSFEASEELKT